MRLKQVMGSPPMKYPFEASYQEIEADPDAFVLAIFSCLESEFLVLPKSDGFVDYPLFEQAYEALKQATGGFNNLTGEVVLPIVKRTPLTLIVLRTILGFTPPEWAYVATQRTGVEVTQGFARALDREVRMSPLSPIRFSAETSQRKIGSAHQHGLRAAQLSSPHNQRG